MIGHVQQQVLAHRAQANHADLVVMVCHLSVSCGEVKQSGVSDGIPGTVFARELNATPRLASRRG